MLKRTILISFLLIITTFLFAQANHKSSLKDFENIILNRSQKIESILNGVQIITDYKDSTIKVLFNNQVIRQLDFKKEADYNTENIVSFFLNTEEALLIKQSLENKEENKPYKIDVIRALYEYPLVFDFEKKLVYISDKGTGNRNPFILDLRNTQEKELIIPETGDYFPILVQDILFFLMAVENGFSLTAYDLKNESYQEIVRGKISCLRNDTNWIYYSEENVIYKIDRQGHLIETFLFNDFIQSFDIYGNLLIISMLNGIQYDLFLYHMLEDKLVRITNTEFHEVDVVFKDESTFIFSSNKGGAFGIYQHMTNEINQLPYYQLIYSEENADIFYPHYSDHYSKIICSIYETGKEPKLLIIPY